MIALSEEYHQIIGFGLAKYMSSTMFFKLSQTPADQEITEKLGTDAVEGVPHRAVPEHVVKMPHNFLTMFPEIKEKVETGIQSNSGNVVESEDKNERIEELEEQVEHLQQELNDAKEKAEEGEASHHKVGVRETNEDNTSGIMFHLRKLHVFPDNGKLDEDSALALWVNKSGDREFMETTANMTYPELKSVSFIKLGKLKKDEDFHLVNGFMAHCFTRPIRYIQLNSESSICLSHFNTGMRPLLAMATRQVMIKKFNIKGISMKDIFESCPQVHRVVFYNCTFDNLENLEIDECIDFKTQTIDVYDSFKLGDEGSAGESTIKHFFHALSKTKMVQSLKTVLMKDGDFPEDGLKQILTGYGFNAKIISGSKWPVTQVVRQ